METLITQVLHTSPVILYSTAFIALVLEGNTSLFTIFFLIEEGYFKINYIIPVIVASLITGGLFWFWIGKISVKRPNFFTRTMDKIADPFDDHLTDSPFRTILLTRFVYALNCATLVRAGQIKMPLRVFLKNLILAELIWLTVVGVLGYTFGAILTITQIKILEITLIIGIVLFFAVRHYITRFVRRRLRE